MEPSWEKLIPMGLPYGPARTRESLRFSGEAVRASLAAISDDFEELDAALREPLLAWLCAFRQHWRPAWESEVGLVGDRLIEELERRPYDLNRYLKLRRIAIENLSTLV